MMNVLRTGFVAAAVALAAVPVGVAQASVPVYDTAVAQAQWISSRSLSMSSLEVLPNAPDPDRPTELVVAWNISFNLGLSLWDYRYTITWTPTSARAISHMVLDLSTTCTSAASGCVQSPKLNGTSISSGGLEYGSFDGTQSGNPGMAGVIQGIKFDVGSGTPYEISFLSNRAPVWGDIYMKSGQLATSGWVGQNPGIDNHASTSINDFIARPDTTGSPVCANGGVFPLCSPQNNVTTPEPVSLSLMGVGLAGLVAMRRRRRRAA